MAPACLEVVFGHNHVVLFGHNHARGSWSKMLVGKMWSHHDSIDKANRKVAIMGAYWIFKDGTHNAGMMVVPGSWAPGAKCWWARSGASMIGYSMQSSGGSSSLYTAVMKSKAGCTTRLSVWVCFHQAYILCHYCGADVTILALFYICHCIKC